MEKLRIIQIAIALGLLTLQLNAQVWVTNGLAGYYPFNGNASDESGNGNGATVNGAALGTNRFAQANNGYRFAAVGQWLSTTNYVGFPASTNDFTVSVWVKLERLMTSDYSVIFANRFINSFQLNFTPFNASGTILQFYTGNTGSNDGTLSQSPRMNLQSNVWYHVAVVRRQNVITLFLNGDLAGQGVAPQGNNAIGSDRNLDFGFRSSSWQHQLYGQLDDIRIYTRALSETDVTRIYRVDDPTSLGVKRAVYLESSTMKVGFDYQLQTSTNLNDWVNYGPVFTATNSFWESPDIWKVDYREQLYFRLQQQ